MKMRGKMLAMFLAAAMVMGLTACGSSSSSTTPTTAAETEAATTAAAEETEAAETTEAAAAVEHSEGILLMATTTSTDNTGLLDYLAPLFKEATGYELQWTAVGTGEALQMGQDGEVDIVLVHAKARELTFVEEGWGVERFPVMYNDFVIVGPEDGPIADNNNVGEVFQAIMENGVVFVSRGDDSGTHTKEQSVWKAVGIENYEDNENYISAGAGMGDTLIMAQEMGGYCLTDRGTWLAKQASLEGMKIVCEGSDELLNQYGVIAINPEKYPDVNNAAANAFIEWIRSDEVQTLIGEFGMDEYGQPLFWPNANDPNA